MVEENNSINLIGTAASRGIAFGKIVFLQRNTQGATKTHCDDPEKECARFEEARQIAIDQLGELYEASLEKLGEQNAVIFQIHQMMLDDPEYVNQIQDLIKTEQVNAEYAVDVIAQKFEQMFKSMVDNDYMQGRAADVIDISRRVISILSKGNNPSKNISSQQNTNDEPIILATDDLAPSETVSLDLHKVRGIITSQGSTRSHTVIFARTMGLPAVISLGDSLNESLEGQYVIVDGSSGSVLINPDDNTIAHYKERKKTEDALHTRLEQFRGKETKTISGRKINLYANIGSINDLEIVKSSDAEGIGLFRSEYIYLQAHDFPTEEMQFNIYKQVALEMGNKRAIIRTLDIGADKTADYFMLKKEENPAMGYRAVRICLTEPEIFKTQLKALYRASAFGNICIMFPMITSVEEVKGCLHICEEVKAELREKEIAFNENLEVGIMIETPAAALISDELAPLVDFFSIGTNDLTQFTLAVDRQNADLNKFLNPYHHSIIKLIEMTVKNAHDNDIWVGICGELAADEGFTHELIRMGIDEISVTPSSILMLRARIATLG